MIISKKELLDLFQAVYDTEQEIANLRIEASEWLADYAESNELSKKTLKEAYNVYKAFRNGKVTSRDEDYFTILAIIEESFSRDADESNELHYFHESNEADAVSS